MILCTIRNVFSLSEFNRQFNIINLKFSNVFRLSVTRFYIVCVEEQLFYRNER